MYMTSSDLPIGGSTGCDHEHSAMVEEAAAFLRSVPPAERPKPLVPALREMFGLSPVECCEAIRLSHEVQA